MGELARGDGAARGARRMMIEVFVYLQILDVISTLIGFSLGDTEASPFIRLLIRFGPVAGLVASKVVATSCLLLCIFLRRWTLIRWINYWFAGVVMWNLYIVLKVLLAVNLAGGVAAPRPELAPAEVVRTVLTALQNNHSPIPNAGVFTAYRFASPANHAVTGPYGHFMGLVKIAKFAPLLHPHPTDFGDVVFKGEYAEERVTVHVKAGQDAAFQFFLHRQPNGRYRGCWMVDGVT